MDVYVRLYWQHDLDLIALHYSPSLPKIGSLMKEALAAHVRNKPYEVHVPDRIMFDRKIKSCNANIHLYEGPDDDLIDYMKSLHYGLRSNAMKQILRNYLTHMFLLPYAQGSGISFQSRLHTNKQKNVGASRKTALEVEKQQRTPLPQEEERFAAEAEEERKVKTEPVTSPKAETMPASRQTEHVSKKSEAPVVSVADTPQTSEAPKEESDGAFDLFGMVESMI